MLCTSRGSGRVMDSSPPPGMLTVPLSIPGVFMKLRGQVRPGNGGGVTTALGEDSPQWSVRTRNRFSARRGVEWIAESCVIKGPFGRLLSLTTLVSRAGRQPYGNTASAFTPSFTVSSERAPPARNPASGLHEG